MFPPRRKPLIGQLQNSFFSFQQLNRSPGFGVVFETYNECLTPAMLEDCFDFKASGVFVRQKLSKAKNTLALCSRWSHGEILKIQIEDDGNSEEGKEKSWKTGANH